MDDEAERGGVVPMGRREREGKAVTEPPPHSGVEHGDGAIVCGVRHNWWWHHILWRLSLAVVSAISYGGTTNCGVHHSRWRHHCRCPPRLTAPTRGVEGCHLTTLQYMFYFLFLLFIIY